MGLENYKGVNRRLLVPFEDSIGGLNKIDDRDRSSDQLAGVGEGQFDDTIRESDGLTQTAQQAGGSAGGEQQVIENSDYQARKEMIDRLEKEVSDPGFCLDHLETFKDGVKEIVQDAFLRAQEISKQQRKHQYTILPIVDLPYSQTERDVPMGSMSDFLAISSSVRKEVSVIKRKLINVVTNERYTRWVSGADKGRRIDPKLIARIPFGERNFYKYKVESDILDIVVTLLVDESGSMWGDKTKQACRCAVMFSEVLDAINVPFEVIGFSTENRTAAQNLQAKSRGYLGNTYTRAENLAHYMYKRFEDEYTRVKTRLTHIKSRRENYDQDHIEFAWDRLLRYAMSKGTTRKLLIVISDGMPIGGIAARQKLIKVVNTIGCDPNADIVGIGIHTDYVKDFYHKCIEIENVSQLGMNVVRLLSSAILSRKVRV